MISSITEFLGAPPYTDTCSTVGPVLCWYDIVLVCAREVSFLMEYWQCETFASIYLFFVDPPPRIKRWMSGQLV